MTEEIRANKILNYLALGQWAKSVRIEANTGVSGSAIRAFANKTSKLISSSMGYKRSDMSTQSEITKHASVLCSRASAINHRADRLLKNFA